MRDFSRAAGRPQMFPARAMDREPLTVEVTPAAEASDGRGHGRRRPATLEVMPAAGASDRRGRTSRRSQTVAPETGLVTRLLHIR
jgi:hypothetical protein